MVGDFHTNDQIISLWKPPFRPEVDHLKFTARHEQLSFRDIYPINAINVRNAVVLQRLQPVPNSTANVQYAGRRMRSQYVWYRRLRAFQPLRIYL